MRRDVASKVWRAGLPFTGTLVLVVGSALAACGGGDKGSTTPQASGGAVFVISPDHGAPDIAITVSGCGFEPNKELTISASKLGSFPKLSTDASGAFRLDAQVPSIGPGSFIVRASTSDTVFAETNFVIEQQGGDVQRSPTPRPSPATASC